MFLPLFVKPIIHIFFSFLPCLHRINHVFQICLL
uniref:Uncharacterized protein n=1 Tax=Lepeophtheirus salmonis TaxID=72036 RepID=A0A0K2VK99_LEPSM